MREQRALPLNAVNFPRYFAPPNMDVLAELREGATEPWICQAVAALLVATNARMVLELGCFKGHMSLWLCDALSRMGGGAYYGVELEADRQALTLSRLTAAKFANVDVHVVQADSLAALRSLPSRSIEFAWVDDDHTPEHVEKELQLLYNPTTPAESKMAPEGLICMHDVCGGEGRMTPLAGVCVGHHGYALDLPRVGLLGGLGLIQVPA